MSSDRLFQRLGIDKAVAFGLATRLWQLLAGPVTAILITSQFSPELQGYYYTFAGVLAWQVFVELGLHAIIIYFVSHEWEKLSLDETGCLVGNQDALNRLVSFGRQLNRWYSGVAVAFVLIVGVGGLVFFWPGDPAITWIPQWLLLILLTSGTLWMIPCLSILEGCNQVETVNRFRFWLGVAGNVTVWGCLLLDAQLWTIVASAGVRFLGEFLLVAVKYQNFFRRFLTSFDGARFPWKEEVWPMQWRAAVQSITGYFGLAFVTPVLFKYHGSTLAGQMGLTWTLLVVVQGLGQAWIQPRVPTLGILISQKDYASLNHLFYRVLTISSCLVLAGVVGFAGIIWGLTAWQIEIENSGLHPELLRILSRLVKRVLDPGMILLFGIGATCGHVVTCLGIYIRAHRRDPLLAVSTGSTATMGLAIYLLGRFYADIGAGIGYTGALMLVALPGHLYVMRAVQNHWHQPSPERNPATDEAGEPTDTSGTEH